MLAPENVYMLLIEGKKTMILIRATPPLPEDGSPRRFCWLISNLTVLIAIHYAVAQEETEKSLVQSTEQK